jgi:Skp family chaperone for outer membrane proteins
VFQHRLFLTVTAAAILLAPLAAAPAAAQAQQSQDWFVPGQGQKAPAARSAARPAPTPAAAPAPSAEGAPPDAEAAPVSPQQLEVVLPPPPDVPQITRGSLPPAAVIGVISVPDVMRGSTAYQAVDKELGQRRQKLNEDAQKEQTTLRDMGQALANDRAKMTPEQIRNKERELQDRIADSRRKFADRNRIIQEAGQYALAQIERTLRIVVQQVAGSRGMNLVLHGPQVALNIPEFDITQEVVTELNKVLPSVSLPPDGVSVLDLKPTAAAKGGKPEATPAAAKPAPKKP